MLILPGRQLVHLIRLSDFSRLHIHLSRPSFCLTVACSSFYAVSITHIFMFISPGLQFDSKLHVHLTWPSSGLTVTISSSQAIILTQSYMFILPGRQFDLYGNLKHWWPKQVVDEFTRRAQCIVDQYNNYTVPEINLNVRKI